MPNGISCAFFAAKNFKIAKENHDIFRAGITGAQTIRTVDHASKASTIINNTSKFSKTLSNIASWCKKLVYPLIIASGIHKTIKSNDKVKTGFSQAAGIGTMYCFEEITENLLKKIPINNIKINNKFLKPVPYILKGLIYAGASILGYNIGSKISEKAVDKVRESKQKTKPKDEFDYIQKNIFEQKINTIAT